jgi:D-alanine--poly(phosphoribitol) ligase subunit 1
LLVEEIDRIGCTAWFSVPSLLMFLLSNKALSKVNFSSMRRFVFGGEGFPKARLQKLYEMYSDRATFFNVYGPTECTCICSSYVISNDDFDELQGFPPLGAMVENFDYQIVDEDCQPVTRGEPGELCLLGPNVGKGYFNDPERTANHFVQNPQSQYFPHVMYKTGDLVRFCPNDGKIYILGRVDNQVKHMGYRIELEEIENGLCCLDYVEQAAVVHGERRGLSQLLAVVQVNQHIEVSQLRGDLKNILPTYMIPTDFQITLEEILKNQNGKIDRKTIASQNF